MPERVRPMLARTGPLPADEREWGFEVKWDGIRVVLFADRGQVRLQGRTMADFTPRYPELRELGRALEGRQAVLDGEVVALDDHGRPSFELLQQRMHLASDAAVRSRIRDVPVTYVAFDVLYLDGRSTLRLAYEQRRALLEGLALDGAHWRTPDFRVGEGAELLAATARLGVEGVVAKRLACPYEPGRRASTWLKVKNVCSQDVVIGGYTRGEGGRSGRFGALAVGHYEDGLLLYAGKVGTGFTEVTIVDLERRLQPLRRDGTPFHGRQPPRGTVFVEPRLVAHVEFREWTASGTLRAPSFKGLRPDKQAVDVVREPQAGAQ